MGINGFIGDLKMAQLIDSYRDNQSEYKGKWYIAKPLTLFSIKQRIKDVWGVLTGKYTAIYFQKDIRK